MRVSIWRQERKGAHWYRLGVVEFSYQSASPFRFTIPHGDDALQSSWPRVCYYPIERQQFDLFSRERRVNHVTGSNGDS